MSIKNVYAQAVNMIKSSRVRIKMKLTDFMNYRQLSFIICFKYHGKLFNFKLYYFNDMTF